jgi:hypothetical protein
MTGMLDLAPHAPLARCTKADCGWEGIPTSWRGKVQTECPKCEGFGDELDLREHRPAYTVHITQRGIFTPGKPRIERAPKQGRNELCACGSGLKFKKCCGA